MNKKLFTAFMIVTTFFLVVGFFQKCSTTMKLNDQKDQISSLQTTLDSLIAIEIENEKNKLIPVTPKQVKDEMESTMLDFLIYEDDLDKGKTSLSEIKNKIEANDEK